MLENPIVRCNAPGRWIPDNYYEGVTDTIVVPQGRTVTDVDVKLKVEHEWVGDLVFELRHDSTIRRLVDRVGVPVAEFGCEQDDIDVTLDDEGTGPVEDGCSYWTPSVVGNLIPNESLSLFDGRDMGGDWNLRAADMEGMAQGRLIEWCLVVTWQ
jgi:subtilisin-like proprotein convertase family protein